MAKVVSEGAFIGARAAGKLDQLSRGKAALAIGPGLGTNEETWRAIRTLVAGDLPKVVDADALNLLARFGGTVGKNTVLTPHPGEMARLCGADTQDIAEAPVDYARQLAQDMDCCVLLKGATTVVAQGEDVTLSVTGCEAMATGGSGVVLAGVIAGLMAQGMPPLDAARAGAYYHGRAGEAAKAALGSRAVTAKDILGEMRIG